MSAPLIPDHLDQICNNDPEKVLRQTEGTMKDVSAAEASRQRRERRRHSEVPDKRKPFSKRPEYPKADSWSILFRATLGPTDNRLIIEKWRAGLPSI